MGRFAVPAAIFILLPLASANERTAAEGVLGRLLKGRAKEFHLLLDRTLAKTDAYQIQASNGIVTVKGTGGVALCRGAYDYLKSQCKAVVTWDTTQVKLPPVLPDLKPTTVVTPNRYRHYFNVCTFGYTTAFWTWERWQKEIDWMALHGINMPLAMTGQEKIWLDVWTEMGFTDAEVRAYFSGPAFLPWHRMGNINSHGGPLPSAWIDQQADLQRKILTTELELGMNPVTPAFSGFVPPSFSSRFPEAKVRPSSPWAGFESTFLLDPRDSRFERIQKAFISRYRQEFGLNNPGLYLVDLYNEMTPVIEGADKLAELSSIGKSVVDSIIAADKSGTWVMQGWLFLNEASFWGQQETAAFLNPVPDNRMIVLDLSGESREIWRLHESFRKKPYIWNFLHNFGQNTRLFGNLDQIAEAPIKALNDPDHGNWAGMGLTPEGIEQNSGLYEMMCDNMWRTEAFAPVYWLREYAYQRYGSTDTSSRYLQFSLLKLFYDPKQVMEWPAYLSRPGFGSIGDAPEVTPWMKEIFREFLRAPRAVAQSRAYTRDLVDFSKAIYALEINRSLAMWKEAHAANDETKVQAARSDFRRLMLGLDELLASVPEYQMSRWIDMARAWGSTPAEKNLMEWNARMQVTIWGGPILHDYACKEWSGLVSDFYLPRWERFLDAAEKGDPRARDWDLTSAAWEEAWCKRTGLKPTASANAAKNAKKLLDWILARPEEVEDRGLAYRKPVTSNGNEEGDHLPSFVTDGRAGGGYWAGRGAPNWVQIDLEEPMTFGRIVIFAFAGDSRYYQYRVEASHDGNEWRTVVDRSANTAQSTRAGYTDNFAPVKARYIRVTMLKNSANPSVHLHEVRVFAK